MGLTSRSNRMKFSIILNHVLKETFMHRPDLGTLSCVNVECQHFMRPCPGNLNGLGQEPLGSLT